ncbi:MAG: anaerobic glycerol-3-phosphate dehydrogenase subunit GlpB [Candidatus Thorarchaeota archaeon]
MHMETDVLVIGGGLAGLVAGTRAAEAGYRVLLVQKGHGATAYSSGAFDVIGYLPDALEPLASPVEGLSVLAQVYPLHPYSIAGYPVDVESGGETAVVLALVSETVEWLKGRLDKTSAALSGSLDSNLIAMTVLGTTKPTCLLQKSMVSLPAMEDEEDGVLLFAGVRGYADFAPGAAAKVFLRDRMMNKKYPQKIAHCQVQISPSGTDYNISGVEIARHLDHPGSIDSLAKELAVYVDQFGATDVALPPVLGIQNAISNKAALEEKLGVRVFELLGLPPSVPGLRLQNSLEQMYLESGGTLLKGHEVVSYTMGGDRLVSVQTKGPSRDIQISAQAFVLATGKFIGGGLSGDKDGVRETVFDLMSVTGEFFSAEEASPSRSTSRLAVSPLGQPVLSSGVSVDPFLRPVKRNGLEWATNLFSAGSIIAGYNYATEKSGLGVAATTGYTAALRVTEYLKEVA